MNNNNDHEKLNNFNPTSLDELFVGYEGGYPYAIIFDDAVGREIF